MGLFKLKVTACFTDSFGRSRYRVTTLVTAKGQRYFVNLFMNMKKNDLLVA